jgi:type II secretory pathway pseudopilin PulG
VSRRRRIAFTLVELLVVVAIIALLVTLLLPTLSRAKDLARRALCLTNLRGLTAAASVYAEQFDGQYPPYRQWHPDPERRDKYFLPYSTRNVFNGQIRDSKGDLVPLNMCMFWEMELLPGAEMYYCPAQTISYYNLAAYPQPFDKTNRKLSGYWRTAYYYNPHVINYKRAYTTQTEFPAGKIFAMDILHEEKAIAHWDAANRPGWCCSFATGNAKFLASEKVLILQRRTPYIGNSWRTFDEARNELEGIDGP